MTKDEFTKLRDEKFPTQGVRAQTMFEHLQCHLGADWAFDLLQKENESLTKALTEARDALERIASNNISRGDYIIVKTKFGGGPMGYCKFYEDLAQKALTNITKVLEEKD